MSETAYPLSWPFGRPRRRSGWRNGNFRSGGKWLTVSTATARVLDEVRKLGGNSVIISSNVQLRRDGLPYSGQKEPDDRGVCVYFRMDGQPYAMACDLYTTVADNLAAVAAHIEATRAITRHGVASAAETLQAFHALPAPGGRHWSTVLNLPRDAKPDDVKAAHRRLLIDNHPDRGGNESAMAEINAARDAALKETT